MSVNDFSKNPNLLFVVAQDDDKFDIRICQDTTIEDCALAISYLIKTVISEVHNPIEIEKAEMILFDRIQEIILEDETVSVEIEDDN